MTAHPTQSALLSWRNRLTHRVCNFMLNHVATIEYRAWIDVSIRRGLKDILKEAEEARPTLEDVEPILARYRRDDL